MVNENPSGQGQGSGQSTGPQSKQQSSEISQGATSQQGSGQGTRSTQDSSYTGHYGAGGAQETGYPEGQGQQGRQPSGSALQARGTTPSVYGGYGSLYGGPFSMMRRITDEMDRLFESFGLGRGFFPSELGQFGRGGGGERTSSPWTPHVDVAEREGKLVISADLPGVKKDDVSVELNGDSVTIQGHRQQESTTNERGYYHSERSYGSFLRTIPLPEGTNTENATATFRDGVLQIELQAPKQESRGRTLEIKSGLDEGGTRSAPKSGPSGSTSTPGQQR